jgi:hypothetical protein
MLEFITGLHQDISGTGDQILNLEKPIHAGF